ncbi:MAG: sn-glycerol-1-phosphate dehydrogenase [Oscillospiraceae bacterium]|jgi:glycerol-1-phosphate dehydrogenase [NAD(P)+]|nr:sn-glycerol-1-phosphate dehydrogenase [Oscillospiraceae bacterium]
MDIQAALLGAARCPACGQAHGTSLLRVDIGRDAWARVAPFLMEQGLSRLLVVADDITWGVAGQALYALLRKAGLEAIPLVLASGGLLPDEAAIGAVVAACPPDVQALVAVGTGTVGDIVKFCSHRVGKPYVAAATAPSMDGFASVAAAMHLRHMKTTLTAHVPLAIFGDMDTLCQAPMEMIAAGLGDTLGKHNCLNDWDMGRALTGEYHCPHIEGMVRSSLAACEASLSGLVRRDGDAVAALAQALVITGVAMSFAGNSRPASGAEHHLSHYWEMQALFAGRKPALHGLKVGLGTLVTLDIARALAGWQVNWQAAAAHARAFDADAFAARMAALYGPAAPEVIALERAAGKNAPQRVLARLQAIRAQWPALQAALAALPGPERVRDQLAALGAPTRAGQMGISAQEVADAVLAAKEMRDRYTVLQLAYDLGAEQAMAERAAGAWA